MNFPASIEPSWCSTIPAFTGGNQRTVVREPGCSRIQEAVTAELPDLLLSDMVMTGLSGFDLCRRLKADPAMRLLPLALITSVGDEHKIEGIEAGPGRERNAS